LRLDTSPILGGWRAAGAEIVRGKRVHFMGIGGVGVSGLARLARAAGAEVSGCDRKVTGTAAELRREGVCVLEGHSPEHLDGVDLLCHTAAVRETEPELTAARAKGMEAVSRLPMLLKLAEGRRFLGVAGSHGKTTTSALLAKLLVEAGLDPTCAVGGVSAALGGNARAGSGDWFVAEIDESDGFIEEAACEVAVLTNVDLEHVDRYPDLASVSRAFGRFLANTRDGGAVVACADSPRAATIARSSAGRVTLYGLSESADVRAEAVELGAGGSRFRAVGPQGAVDGLTLPLPGLHNVQNAAAVAAVAFELRVSEEALRRALAWAPRVERRFSESSLPNGARLIVDYAHHPAEIAATVAAARFGAEGKLVAVFQPHRYSRTKRLGEGLGAAFAGEVPAHLPGVEGAAVDDLIVLPVYAASEDPLPGATPDVVADSARRGGVASARTVGSREAALDELARAARPEDTVLVLGAGDVNGLADDLRARI
jgi:UDP-N-acetylmuramate--alanine ligase